jgi:hypothetical protein
MVSAVRSEAISYRNGEIASAQTTGLAMTLSLMMGHCERLLRSNLLCHAQDCFGPNDGPRNDR